MQWQYKYKGKMDCNDADYVYSQGSIGTYDDNNRSDMVELFLTIILLDKFAGEYDAGTNDREKVLNLFRSECANTPISKDEVEKFISDHYLDESIFDFVYDFMPRDPNDDSNAHDLSFDFYRIPCGIKEEPVYSAQVQQFISPLPTK
jgi:hypothetical protein